MSGLTAWERWELASLDTLETPANESAAEDAPDDDTRLGAL